MTIPGTLSTILADFEDIPITELTIIGIIDARDIGFISGNLKYLEKINLNNAEIAYYEGYVDYIQGYEFPANKLPDSTFIMKYLTSIILPKNLTNIGRLAFAYCSELKSVTVNWDIPLLLNDTWDGVFHGVDLLHCTLIVPAGTRNLYATADVWQNFGNIVEMMSVDITSLENTNLIEWQSVEDATGYCLIIYANVERTDTVCIVTFDEYGNYVSIVYRAKPRTTTVSTSYFYELENLLSNTEYYYAIIAYKDDTIIAEQQGSFVSTEIVTNIDVLPDEYTESNIVGYYSILGQKLLKEPVSGVYIILYDNGKVEKVLK
ncbi:hypothetical protein FACS189434_09110 [Bacteroidia bacterium]|nr:hypothetical protein FACS189434_09110 [Bacteroidia bacterium]